MAEGKKSFILYRDIIHTIKLLPKKTQADLFMHILRYVNDENPQSGDVLLLTAFEPIKQQLKRDLEIWSETIVKRSEAGKASAEKKRQQNQHVLTCDNKRQQTSTNPTVNVNDSVNVNETINTCALFLWVNENCKRVQKLKDPITNEQAEQLEKDFGIENCQSLFLDMENYKKLNETYTSANLTFRKWIARDKKTIPADRFGHKQTSTVHTDFKKL